MKYVYLGYIKCPKVQKVLNINDLKGLICVIATGVDEHGVPDDDDDDDDASID